VVGAEEESDESDEETGKKKLEDDDDLCTYSSFPYIHHHPMFLREKYTRKRGNSTIGEGEENKLENDISLQM